MRAAMEVAHALPAHFHSLPLASCRGRVRRKGARLVRRSAYGERDYAFGQLILTLRSAIGLTQAGLSDQLGIGPLSMNGPKTTIRK